MVRAGIRVGKPGFIFFLGTGAKRAATYRFCERTDRMKPERQNTRFIDGIAGSSPTDQAVASGLFQSKMCELERKRYRRSAGGI